MSKPLATTSSNKKKTTKKQVQTDHSVKWKTPAEKKQPQSETVSKGVTSVDEIQGEYPEPGPIVMVEIEVPPPSNFTYAIKYLKVNSETQTDALPQAEKTTKETQTVTIDKQEQWVKRFTVIKETQTDAPQEPERSTKQSQTFSPREVERLSKETQTVELPKPIKLEKGIQSETPNKAIQISQSTQTDVVARVNQYVQTIRDTDAPEEIRPYHPQSLEGVRLTDVFILYPLYEAIEVVDDMPWTLEQKRKFPTKWIPITSPYWDQFRSTAESYDLAEPRRCVSWMDDATVWVQKSNNHLYATRNGYKVIIRYPNGGTGNRYRYPPLFELEPNEPIQFLPRPNGVPVAFIPHDCPYWHHLFSKLTFSVVHGFTKTEVSTVDPRQYLVLIETNGQVDVICQGRRFRVRNASLSP